VAALQAQYLHALLAKMDTFWMEQHVQLPAQLVNGQIAQLIHVMLVFHHVKTV